MTDETRDSSRRMGVDFGALSNDLERVDYPTSAAEVLAAFGSRELVVADGTRTVSDVLSVLADERGDGTTATETVSFESATDVRQTVLTCVDDAAIGRKDYSDRTPYAPGELLLSDQESF